MIDDYLDDYDDYDEEDYEDYEDYYVDPIFDDEFGEDWDY